VTWRVPLCDVDIGDEEIAAATDVLRSKWLTMGAVTQRFEAAFAEAAGVKHAFAVTNGTAALQLAYRVVGLGRGDEFVLPSLTFVATANAGIVEGGTPVLADIASESDLTVGPQAIDRVLTPRTRAITVVHYAGYACDMTAILEVARARGVAVIEDCAHSPGARRDGRATGGWGDVGCFSFFSNKNMTTGEGGMVTTNRDDLADRLRLLRSHGMTTLTTERHKGHAFSYDVLEAGYNFRIDEVRSAIGLVQLGKLGDQNRRRRAVVAAYRDLLPPQVDVPFREHVGEPSFHIMPVLLPVGKDRSAFMRAMKEEGVPTSIHYPPLHTFSSFAATRHDPLPVTDRVAPRLVTLPLYGGMEASHVAIVCEAVRRALGAA
jgi:dTDP-4-amino-4,6-dideoxygalactose transaminase